MVRKEEAGNQVREDKDSGKKIEIFHEGQILFGILSFILYCKDAVLRNICPTSGKLSHHTARGLTWNRPYPGHPVQVQAAHSGISAERSFLICRKDKRDTSAFGEPA